MKNDFHKINVALILLSLLECIATFIPNYVIDRFQISGNILKGISVCAIFVYFFRYSRVITHIKLTYKTNIIIILISILVSVFMAYVYHDQNIFVGLTAASLFSVFILYFIFPKMNITKSDIEQTIVIFGLLSVFVIILSFFTIPKPIFGGIDYDPDRGGVRFRAGEIIWVYLFMFYTADKLILTHKKIYLVLLLVSYASIITLLTRQYILISTLFLFMFFICKSSKKYKILFLSIFIIGLFYLSATELYSNIKSMTLEQSNLIKHSDDIRVKAAEYFSFQGQTDIMTILFGNGVWSVNNSSYGSVLSKYGYFPADVGYLGFFYFFGFLCLLSFLSMLKNAIIDKYNQQSFQKYFLLCFACSSVVGGAITYHAEIYILLLMIYYKDAPKNILTKK